MAPYRTWKSFLSIIGSLLSFISLANSCPGQPPDRTSALAVQPITTAREVRSLNVTAATEARQVRLRGVVTALSGWKSSFFFEDSSAGISVDRVNELPQVQPGQEVEISGVTGPGEFAPVVVAQSVRVLGQGRFPNPRRIELADISSGRLDSQWIEATGVVVSAAVKPSWGRDVLFVDLHIGGQTIISLRVHDFPEDSWRSLPGSEVSVKGVCGTIFNDKRQFIGLRLFVSNLSNLQILHKAPADPFDYPLRSLAELRRFDPDRLESEFVRVRGVITYPQFQQTVYIQDGTNGIAVHSVESVSIPSGTEVEVVGFLGHGEYSPSLEYARLRVVAATSHTVKPEPANATDMIGTRNGFSISPHDSQLVQLKGVVVENVSSSEENILFVKDGDSVFTARLPRLWAHGPLPAKSTFVQVTGICATRIDATHEPKSFQLLLRSTGDVVLLDNPPWWNISHATSVAEILAAAFLVVSALLVITRREAALRKLAFTDTLTGLYNRRGFVLWAEQHWHRASLKQAAMLLFYIDVDRFKQINDSHGHRQGDAALELVATVLRETFRKTDLIGRLGGDEFAVATVDAKPNSQQELELRLAACVENVNQHGDREFVLSLSVGVLLCDAALTGLNIEQLLARADKLMYSHKCRRADESGIQTNSF